MKISKSRKKNKLSTTYIKNNLRKLLYLNASNIFIITELLKLSCQKKLKLDWLLNYVACKTLTIWLFTLFLLIHLNSHWYYCTFLQCHCTTFWSNNEYNTILYIYQRKNKAPQYDLNPVFNNSLQTTSSENVWGSNNICRYRK